MNNDVFDRIVADYAKRYPPLITVHEAAEIARHETAATIYDWSSRGLLDDIKSRCGRRLLLDLVGFVKFLLDQQK